MKVLIIGSGGREHALAWKLASSPLVSELHAVPGNPGIAEVARCHNGDPVEVAREIGADFVVVGPDGALADGVVDRLAAAGIPAFGPTRSAARLESSKIFCKELLLKYGIPTARAASFGTAAEAKAYLEGQPDGPIVVKADGLAVGKGVVVAKNRDEAMAAVDEVLGIAAATQSDDAGRVLIEELMTGEEVSFFALTDGTALLPLIDVQDHKRIGEGDTGPNTGGMGCFSPVPSFTPELRELVIQTILLPTLAALRSEGVEFRGALFLGLMLTPEGPKVVEYNARFGDPETQVIMARLESDLLPLLLAAAGAGETPLHALTPSWRPESGVCVVLAAAGYPGEVRKGDVISGISEALAQNALIFQAGTKRQDGELVTGGGRVLGVTALGPDLAGARAAAYQALNSIQFPGAQYRRDIGWRHLGA